MAIRGASMAGLEDDKDGLDHDAVMPGFRFHPTEEELVEFYLRRKVEGKRFNVEIISFLELYRYDPWELPAMATIGEKEWFFYVPRDKKYRNGDRPNRVTTSGYWKATGADRTIRTEGSRSIGGVRTNWIMNEYRLPRDETERNQKAEISLCRVYKRSGIEENSRALSSRPSSSRGAGSDKKQAARHQPTANFQDLTTDASFHVMEKIALPTLHRQAPYGTSPGPIASLSSTTDEELTPLHAKDIGSLMPSSVAAAATPVEEAHRIVGYNQSSGSLHHQQFILLQQSQLPLTSTPTSMAGFPDKLWEWNPLP
ncbi:unnamed protein product [Spirodela intermedia]|uniref:NAC domain-containing protein n=1 Tax=Spirodela intermedia TaxID=51605 RepID=A0A7I8ITG9_SPIIN|nr:unnamed protein product [Spirodela intermedia]CAA6660254.1 unnamed protein product [Spirodela intermedia]